MAALERHSHTIRARATELDALQELHDPIRGRRDQLVPHVLRDAPDRARQLPLLRHTLDGTH
eukprot:11184285-Lingulodinium_polyedra.AAC.1